MTQRDTGLPSAIAKPAEPLAQHLEAKPAESLWLADGRLHLGLIGNQHPWAGWYPLVTDRLHRRGQAPLGLDFGAAGLGGGYVPSGDPEAP